MKKILGLLSLCVVINLLSLCTIIICAHQVMGRHHEYTTSGCYYASGVIVTDDGNIWDYQLDAISDRKAYDGTNVHVVFDDNGTSNNIYDDIIVSVLFSIRDINDNK